MKNLFNIITKKSNIHSDEVKPSNKTEVNEVAIGKGTNVYRSFSNYYLTEKQFNKKKDAWFSKYGSNANIDDFKWSIYNEMLAEYGKKNDYYNMKIIYLEMAIMLSDQNKDNFKLLQLCRKMELHELGTSNLVTEVTISPASDSCEECKKLVGKTFSIKQALVEMPLPHSNCKHKLGCRCIYSPALSGYDEILNR